MNRREEGVSRSTVPTAHESVRARTAPGDPAPYGDYAIGIDIGATKIALGVVTPDGHISALERLATRAYGGGEAAIEAIASVCRRLVDTLAPTGRLAGVGIGCTGPLDLQRGTVENDYTLDGWKGLPLVRLLESSLGVPVALENDADAALLGEYRFGVVRGERNVVMLTFGTGVGSAALIGGRIVRGASGEHPELGHIKIAERGRPCYCGLTDCLESWTSGTALERTSGERGWSGGAAELQARFEAGHDEAVAVVGALAEDIAAGAATLVQCFLPQALVLGGGLMTRYFSAVRPVVERRLATLEFARGAVRVVRPRFDTEAGIVGAAATIYERRTKNNGTN